MSILDNFQVEYELFINGTPIMSINVNLTPQLEELVRAKVTSGLYNSASEVVREALRLMDEQDRFRQAKLDELRRDVRKGIDSGPSEAWSAPSTPRLAWPPGARALQPSMLRRSIPRLAHCQGPCERRAAVRQVWPDGSDLVHPSDAELRVRLRWLSCTNPK